MDGLNDIRRAGASGDERRVAIERTIPEPPHLVVAVIPGKEKLATQTRAKVFDVRL
jgi:predicted ABC-type transport system involved in lysophospholipase L1 biosynthesis ATPase subunit